MSIKVIRYRLPSYWACPLINDDYTGLTDEECEEIKRFLEAAEGYPVDVDWGTQGFYRCNDAGTLPGECADFIFHKCNDQFDDFVNNVDRSQLPEDIRFELK